jgi:hypothetical protein
LRRPFEQLVVVDALAAVEGIEDQVLACAGRDASEEVHRESRRLRTAPRRDCRPRSAHRQRDGNARAARQHVVQEAVADVVVLLGVSA